MIGWKEFELEVMRDHEDNVVIVCSIENLDPMGVHTGDSITVAPAMTLTDREYQTMRDAAVAIIREVGVDAGGCNIQFAVNPADGEMLVIEMNPRVSRSSALASKATGFPIARIGAKLAVGYRLDEIPNDITKTTPASFEPVLDYVVVKIPRFAFEKFPSASPYLTTQMKSVGEAMAIGRTFKEAFQKGLRSLENGRHGWTVAPRLQDDRLPDETEESLRGALRQPTPERIFQVKRALERGLSVAEVYELTGIDPWFLEQMVELIEAEREYAALADVTEDDMRRMKRMGFSDRQLGALRGEDERAARERRWALNVRPSYKMVDTCAGEFPSSTPYLYGCYDEESEAPRSGKRSVVILGSGPNRIGQGVEFDYCCVRAVLALRERGFETIMINSNPETVSTDFDTSDKLYFEPLTFEDVLEIVQREQPEGVIVQLGGQTPLKLTRQLEAAGVRILGTSPDAIDIAEDRRRFEKIARELGLAQPPNGTATSFDEALEIAERIGYPVLVRPSYVLGGRAMQIVYDAESLQRYFQTAVRVSEERPVLVDRFLEDAFECDVDAISDGQRVVIGGIMQHIEDAGIHSGDSACVLPPYLDRRIRHAGDARADGGARDGARRGWPDQRAVRDQGWRRVRARGESARQPHDSVRVEGDRRSARVARRARDARRDARRDRIHRGDHSAIRLGEGGGVSVQQVPGHRSRARPGDAVDGRVHGDLRLVRIGVRQSTARGVERPAARRLGADHGRRLGQADGHADRATISRDGLQDHGDGGHGRVPARARHSRAARPQGARRVGRTASI